MSFKVNDLVLCVDARPTPGWTSADRVASPLREGAVYTVRAVQTCCCARLALVGVGDFDLCMCCCGAGPQLLAWYTWRFIKAGEVGARGVRVRRTADEMLRDSFRDDAVKYLTKEV